MSQKKWTTIFREENATRRQMSSPSEGLAARLPGQPEREALLDQLHRPVVVAMVAVRMMQPSVHDIVGMVAMRHGVMSAGRAMGVICAAGAARAMRGVGCADPDDMLVDMIGVHVVEVTIMEIVDMALMANRSMAAFWPVLVRMVGMVRLGAGGHGFLLLHC